MATDIRIVYVTAPSGDPAQKIADTLVQEGLIACANRLGPVVSTYIWEGKLEHENEDLLILKTSARKMEALLKRIPEIHPYDVPEAITTVVNEGLQSYLSWVRDAKGLGTDG